MSQQQGTSASSDQNVQNGHEWSGDTKGGASQTRPKTPESQGSLHDNASKTASRSPGENGRTRELLQINVEDAEVSHPNLPSQRAQIPTPKDSTTCHDVLERLRRATINVAGGSSTQSYLALKLGAVYRIVVFIIVIGAVTSLVGMSTPYWFRSMGPRHGAMNDDPDPSNVTYMGLWEMCFSNGTCVVPIKFQTNLMLLDRVLAVAGSVGYAMSSAGFLMGCFHQCFKPVRSHACNCLLLLSASFSAMAAIVYLAQFHDKVTKSADFFVSFYLVIGSALVAMVCGAFVQMTEYIRQHGQNPMTRSSIEDVEAAADNQSTPTGSRPLVVGSHRVPEHDYDFEDEEQPLMDPDGFGREDHGQGNVHVAVCVGDSDDWQSSGQDSERLTGPVPKDLSNVRTGLEDDSTRSANGQGQN